MAQFKNKNLMLKEKFKVNVTALVTWYMKSIKLKAFFISKKKYKKTIRRAFSYSNQTIKLMILYKKN